MCTTTADCGDAQHGAVRGSNCSCSDRNHVKTYPLLLICKIGRGVGQQRSRRCAANRGQELGPWRTTTSQPHTPAFAQQDHCYNAAAESTMASRIYSDSIFPHRVVSVKCAKVARDDGTRDANAGRTIFAVVEYHCSLLEPATPSSSVEPVVLVRDFSLRIRRASASDAFQRRNMLPRWIRRLWGGEDVLHDRSGALQVPRETVPAARQTFIAKNDWCPGAFHYGTVKVPDDAPTGVRATNAMTGNVVESGANPHSYEDLREWLCSACCLGVPDDFQLLIITERGAAPFEVMRSMTMRQLPYAAVLRSWDDDDHSVGFWLDRPKKED